MRLVVGVHLWTALGAGAIAGVLSIPHCAGMCGPLAGFACGRSPDRLAPVRYQLGRFASYGAIGAVAGTAGVVAGGAMGAWASAMVSWTLAAALAVVAYRLWRGRRNAVVRLGKSRPHPSLFQRAVARLPKDAAFLGLASGLLPCGALAAAALIAAGTATPLGGALVMIAFAATSGIALLAVGFVGRWARGRTPPARWLRLAAVGLMIGAVVLVVRPIATLTAQPAACCTH